ncbi:hypothetical protein [Streptomyces justiciae]|uniref:HEAT repeat domain-containing protein n=1 Tax=Streptomyces justiciae TaxID=2780140 RepID=A0ABU3LVV3_9ACTN|nr:hypothetical protein [Streptomyces justiciae]MDT7843310.1 hypothetical protein [Streptomyces justiciae]
MNDEDEMFYAHHDCVEGLLQRGRGLGAIRALQVPEESAEFVYDAIRRDWRWHAADDRSVYLARLVQELELPLSPLLGQLAADEEACLRACEVLELLALTGSEEAREGLRAHVRERRHRHRVLESVVPSRTRVPRPSLDQLSTAELLGLLADDRGQEEAKCDALRALISRQPTEELIPLVASLGKPDGHRMLTLITHAVEQLGPAAVPAAKGWVQDERPWLAQVGAQVLAEHPGPEALPGLVHELAGQWAARTWCGPDRTARRLARFGPDAAAAVPYLRRFWLRTPHSYERAAYLEALAVIDPHGLDYALTESLWDCEEPARLLAITSAPAGPEALARIAILRDDPAETAKVRAAARTRLASPTGPGQP